VFKNVMMYRLLSPWTVTVAQLEEAVGPEQFVPCGATQDKSVGWVSPRGDEHGALVEVVAGQWMLKLRIEQKVLPGTVVKRKAEEHIAHMEATTGRKPGRKEVREIREDARLALLPLAFTKQAHVWVWIDPQAGFLLIDAGSQARADEVMTALVKVVAGLSAQLLNTQMSPAGAMAAWLSSKQPPRAFSVDRECELKATDESKAVVRYSRHALDTDEVSQHIALGKMPTRLAMTWNDHVSFVLTEGLQLKKVALLDVVLENSTAGARDGEDDHFDTDVALMTGELAKLLPDLLEALGGEVALA
jgi:recombination associated protein RdgC